MLQETTVGTEIPEQEEMPPGELRPPAVFFSLGAFAESDTSWAGIKDPRWERSTPEVLMAARATKFWSHTAVWGWTRGAGGLTGNLGVETCQREGPAVSACASHPQESSQNLNLPEAEEQRDKCKISTAQNVQHLRLRQTKFSNKSSECGPLGRGYVNTGAD